MARAGPRTTPPVGLPPNLLRGGLEGSLRDGSAFESGTMASMHPCQFLTLALHAMAEYDSHARGNGLSYDRPCASWNLILS